MKCLLKKDIYMLWAYNKIFLLMIPLFLAAGCIQPDNFFFVAYPSILVGVFPVNLIGYEERFRWNIYCETLPIPRWKVVAEKYLLSAILIAIVTVMSAAAQYCIFRQSKPFDAEGYWSTVGILLCMALLSPSFLLPVILRFGTEKGRLAYYFFIGGALAIGSLIGIFGSEITPPQLTVPVLVLLGMALFAGSCFLAIRLYEKREL